MVDSMETVRDRLSKLRRDFGLVQQGDKENLTGSLTNTMDPTTWLLRIGDGGHKPQDWLDYLQYLEHRGQFSDWTNKYRVMWSAYNKAMKAIELDNNRQNEAYAQILVKFAWLKESEDVDEARLLFKFARGNIKLFAFLHVAAAQLERKHNNLEKCISILKKAQEIGAQPRQMVDTAMERCLAGKTTLTIPQDTYNRSKLTMLSEDTLRPSHPEVKPMEVDHPTLAPDVEIPPVVPSAAHDQSQVDSTVSFNLPEERVRRKSSSDEADTIPWINKFMQYNQATKQSTAPTHNPRLAHTVGKNIRGLSNLVTPVSKTQGASSSSVGGASSSSVGGASRRRRRNNIGAATRIKLTEIPYLIKQNSNPDDSDDDDDYFGDFQPLGKISPPTGQDINSKPRSALPAIIESQNSMDSGISLTPLEEKNMPAFPISVNPTDIQATSQQTPPVPMQTPVAVQTLPVAMPTLPVAKSTPPVAVQTPPVAVQTLPISMQTPPIYLEPPPVQAPISHRPKPTSTATHAPPVLSMNQHMGMVPKPKPTNQNEPFVPPKMPVRKSKDTITVNGKHYSILRIIGKGGSSKVFEAFSEDKKVLAIKSVNLEYADEMTIKGYLNEITLLHKLRKSDHIIRLYDYEVTDKHLAIIMERGSVDLSTFLKRNKNINGEKIKFYWLEMLEAVEVVHKQGIIHSDLKPANFLFVEGKLKLIDFGIANSIQADKTSIVRESQVGTLNYMSPEAIQDTSTTPQIDARGHKKPRLKINCKSDVWSLGCILYYMVYGRTPFQQITNTLVKLQAICDPQHEINFPDIENKLLLDVLKKCLIRNPSLRPSIQELLMHTFLKSSGQPTAEVSQDSGSVTMKHVESLIAQLTQLNSPNTRSAVTRIVMEQVASGQEINLTSVLKPSSSQQQPLQQPPPPTVRHATPLYSSGMYQAPPVSSGIVRNSYRSSAVKRSESVPGQPLRPIARVPLQALKMEDLHRVQGSLQPVANSSSAKYMTQKERENNDLESVLRRQLEKKYQHAQPQYDETTYEQQSWTSQTMK